MKTKTTVKTLAGALSAFAGLGLCQLAQAKPAVAPPKVKLTAAKAEKVALKKYPGRLTGKTVLENEDGKWEFAVNVRSGATLREVMVDANTGKIADVEVTTPAAEAAEAKAEAKKAGAKPEAREKDEKGEKSEAADKD